MKTTAGSYALEDSVVKEVGQGYILEPGSDDDADRRGMLCCAPV